MTRLILPSYLVNARYEEPDTKPFTNAMKAEIETMRMHNLRWRGYMADQLIEHLTTELQWQRRHGRAHAWHTKTGIFRRTTR